MVTFTADPPVPKSVQQFQRPPPHYAPTLYKEHAKMGGS
jgi:hypothetical protein